MKSSHCVTAHTHRPLAGDGLGVRAVVSKDYPLTLTLSPVHGEEGTERLPHRQRLITLWLLPGLVKLLFLIAAILVGYAASAADPWPREIRDKEGKAVIYQPQLEFFQGNRVAVRAAVSVLKTGE